MERHFNRYRRYFRYLCVTVLTVLYTKAVMAGVDFAEKPLSVQAPIAPNLLFILDDSGSMDWQFMPDDLRGECDVSSDEDMRDKPVYCQSPYYNQLYYNPDFVYDVPVDGNGDPLPDIDPTQAPLNGFDPTWRDPVNLNEWDTSGGSGSSGSSGTLAEGCEYLYAYDRRRSGWYCDVGDKRQDNEAVFVASYQGESLYRCLDDVKYYNGSKERTYLFRVDGEFNANYGSGGSSAGTEQVLQVLRDRRNTGYYCANSDVEDKTYICTGTPRRASSGDRHWLLEDQGNDPGNSPSALYADDYDRSGSEQWYCRDDDVERAYTNCDDIKYDDNGSGDGDERYWAIDQSGRPQSDTIFYEHDNRETGWYCDKQNDLEKVYHCRGEPQLYTGNGNSDEWWLINYDPSGGGDGGESLLCEDTGTNPSSNAFYYYRHDTDLPGCSASNDQDTDCYTKVTVTDATELQNVANWYSYYRSRILAAKSGVSLAFDELSTSYRIGYGSINNSGTIRETLDIFSNQRAGFYSWLHGVDPSGSTPLRSALDDAGQYFSTDEPYRENLANSGSELLSCQQNFAILMTDGYWNSNAADTGAARADNDSTDGPLITSESGQRFQFKANTEPFDDNNSDTLADIAMYYWKRDLKPDLANNVPFSESNPAFWQHMVSIGIGLGVEGNVAKEDAFAAIDSGQSIDWGDPGSSNAQEEKIDDLLHAAVNSRGDFFSARNPAEFTQNLIAALGTVQTRVASGTSPAVNAAQESGDRLLYRATYRSGDWSGSLSAFGFDPTTGAVDAKQWSASFPAPADRQIFTMVNQGNGLRGAEFTYNNLDADAQATFGNNDGGVAEDIVEYLRGDQSLEQAAGGDFRTRANGILADIVHTSPVYVGSPNELRYRYADWSEASSHGAFAASYANRAPVVYVSSNDGMLHAFHGETGLEIFAYMPRTAILNGAADLSDPDYRHKYLNDGPLAAYDVYLGKSTGWRTVLIGTFGRGGRGLYALDITDPSNFDANDILWEISDQTDGVVGQILAEPTVARLVDGTWVTIQGNGYNSDSEEAALLVIDIASGTLKTIETGVGSTSNSNGLAGALVWDASAIPDFNSDYAYAGDLLGNVWQFDLTPGFDSLDLQQSPTQVMQAVNGDGDIQPITARLTGVANPEDDSLWLFFGTGQLFNADDITGSDSANVQTWYGLSVENAASLPLTRSNLKERDMTEVDISVQNESRFTALRAADIPVAGDMTGKDGWYIDLDIASATGERIISPNLYSGGAIVANSYVPIADSCNPGGDGFIMAVDPFTGGQLAEPFFDLNDDNTLDDDDIITRLNVPIVVAGISFGDVPSQPIFVIDQLVTQLEDGTLETVKTPPPQGGAASPLQRMSWREIRK